MSIVLVGSTSGSITLQEPAVAGTTVLTLPAVSGTVLTTTSPKAGNVIQVVNATEVSPNLSFLESCFKADVQRYPIDINDLSIITEDVVKALGVDEDVARVIVMNRPNQGYLDYPHLTTILTTNGVHLDHKTLEHFKSLQLVVFGGVEELY